MLFSVFKKKAPRKNNAVVTEENKYYLALDIGTEVLKGLLFSVHRLGVDIWGSVHLKQPLKAMRSGVILDEGLIVDNSKLVIYQLKKQFGRDFEINKIVLGLAGELINGISITVDYDRSNLADQPISPDEADFIKRDVFEQIKKEGKGELADRLGVTPDEVNILHLSITGFELDGKKETELVSHRARNVRLFIYASFAPKKYVDTLKNISSRLGIPIGVIVVQPFAVASAFLPTEKGFSGIFIDIGGGTTDVALVEDGNKIQTQMYAFGGRAFTNRIAKEFNLPYNLAEERKLKYSEGALPLNLKDQLRQILIPDVRLWIDSLKIALSEMEVRDGLPENIYLCGGGALLPDIKEIMLTYPWAKYLPFRKQPKISIIVPDSLDKVYDKTGLLVNPYDITPASLARFYWDVLYRPFYHEVGK